MEVKDDNIIVLQDEDGKDVEFDVLLVFDYEGMRYCATLPCEKIEGVGEDEVILFRLSRDGEDELFETIDDDALMDKVFEEFLRLYDEKLDAEEAEEDEE